VTIFFAEAEEIDFLFARRAKERNERTPQCDRHVQAERVRRQHHGATLDEAEERFEAVAISRIEEDGAAGVLCGQPAMQRFLARAPEQKERVPLVYAQAADQVGESLRRPGLGCEDGAAPRVQADDGAIEWSADSGEHVERAAACLRREREPVAVACVGELGDVVQYLGLRFAVLAELEFVA
jgi:hypothetical protein